MSYVSVEADSFLRQFAALKAAIEQGERNLTLGLLDGLKDLVLAEELRPSTSTKGGLTQVDSALLSRFWRDWGTGSRPAGIRCYEFGESVRASGWYDAQVGSKRDTYRWCGRSAEASILFHHQPETLRWVIVRIRPLIAEGLDEASIPVSVNDTGVQVRLIEEEKSCLLCVPIPQGPLRDVCEVLFRPKVRKSPKDLGRNNDTRLLSFNVSRIMEVHEDALTTAYGSADGKSATSPPSLNGVPSPSAVALREPG